MLEDPALILVNHYADAELDEGEERDTEWVIRYQWQGQLFADTMRLICSNEDTECCSINRVDYESFRYTGPLVDRIERQVGLPGSFIYLRQP